MKNLLKSLLFITFSLSYFVCTSFTEKLPLKNKKNVQPPNILFFLVDDMGWMDTSINGSTYYETPNMERLAKMGMTFTHAYAANPLCSPTRASILTGQDPARIRLTTPSGHLAPNPNKLLEASKGSAWQKVATPASKTYLPTAQFTIAEALKENSYTTAHIGKWHLGQKGYWPENHGFDINIGGQQHPGPPSYFSPYKIANLPNGEKNEYITDRVTKETVKFLKNQPKNKPFLLNVWQYGVHAPYQAPKALIEKYASKKDSRGKQSNPIMGAMMEKVDESLGIIMDELIAQNMMDNTIIIFFSDNGGNMYDVVNGSFPTNNYPLSYGKGNIHEGGIRVPCIVYWKDKVEPNSSSNDMIQSTDFYPTILDMTNTSKNPKQKLDGVSLVKLLTKQKPLKRKAIFSHFPHYVAATSNYPTTAVWYKNYKLLKVYGEGVNRTPEFKLYNLKEDISETNNIANSHPKLVNKLKPMLNDYLENIDALVPIKNPNYKPNSTSRFGIAPRFPIERYPSY
ncbi:sulfatase [Algibacter pacificus]|uniref:sulfatase n=1 Tax=Algibacter pacificus TaxID=2599389 RepID=UPI0011CBB094|nr:sulfatase [Algibacter pacificus]